MQGTRPRDDPSRSEGAKAAQPGAEALDDWLGDVSDDDWSERPPGHPGRERDRGAPAHDEPRVPEHPGVRAADRRLADTASHRETVHRRRLVAILTLAVVLVLAGVSAVLLLRDERPSSATPVPEATGTTPTQTETTPASTSPPPAATPTPSPPPPATVAAFTLPEGTKLQSAESEPSATSDLEVITDPEVVTELQQALAAAGYDPGPADGTFGLRTEAAVAAFQQANGLSPDGVVGPETAAKLNEVLASG